MYIYIGYTKSIMYTLGHWYPGHIKCVKALCACTFEWKLAWEHILLLEDLSE